MSLRFLLAFATLGVVIAAPGAQGYRAKAPAFTAMTAAGKSVSLKSLTASKSVVLYFIKKDCPVNAEAEKFFNRIYAATEKGNIVGVFNGDKSEFDSWQARFKAPFPVILDPKSEIIHSFGAARSPWVVQVGTDGRTGKEWHGYSQAIVKEVATVIKAGAKVDATGAPTDPTYG